MDNANFKQYKDKYRTAIRKVLDESQGDELSEAAFPAYTHRNSLINLLFWKRLHIAINYLEHSASYDAIMDFGCGSGVMLPFLASISKQVIAVDIDLHPLQRVQDHITFPSNVRIYDTGQVPLKSFVAQSLDVVVALDVLEHVDDLSGTLINLCQLLKPGGKIIISGPTENLLYRIGRKLAGPEYSGDYDERGEGEIRRKLANIAKVEHLPTIYRPLPLFEVFIGIV